MNNPYSYNYSFRININVNNSTFEVEIINNICNVIHSLFMQYIFYYYTQVCYTYSIPVITELKIN